MLPCTVSSNEFCWIYCLLCLNCWNSWILLSLIRSKNLYRSTLYSAWSVYLKPETHNTKILNGFVWMNFALKASVCLVDYMCNQFFSCYWYDKILYCHRVSKLFQLNCFISAKHMGIGHSKQASIPNTRILRNIIFLMWYVNTPSITSLFL